MVKFSETHCSQVYWKIYFLEIVLPFLWEMKFFLRIYTILQLSNVTFNQQIHLCAHPGFTYCCKTTVLVAMISPLIHCTVAVCFCSFTLSALFHQLVKTATTVLFCYKSTPNYWKSLFFSKNLSLQKFSCYNYRWPKSQSVDWQFLLI